MDNRKKTIRTGMVDRARAAAKDLTIFSRADVFHYIDALKPLSLEEEKSFRKTWHDLKKRGEIYKATIDGYKGYGYCKDRAPSRDIREKIYRAMHVKGAFCAADLKKLTDADQSYISAIIRRLAKAGWLELTGKKGKHMVFRVKNPNKFYQKQVMGNR